MKNKGISIILAGMMAVALIFPAAADEQSNLEQYVQEHEDELPGTEAILEDLSAAESDLDRQYEDMEKRIQYIYENGGSTGWAVMVLGAEDVTDLLNRAEYVQQIEETDQRALEKLEDTVQEISELKSSLEIKQKTAFEEDEDEESYISDDCDEDYYDDDDYDDYDDYDDDDYSGSGSGQFIVDYADEFVGGPYVWGGNSLTNGCDCSHFVYLVLSNSGVWDGGYMTSGDWAGAGSSVGSLSNAQAGDVIVYSGHVAIYDGDGGIVEAQSESTGITHYRSATYKSIISIRRFV